MRPDKPERPAADPDNERLKIRLMREKSARRQAEDILETKSRELYSLNQMLEELVEQRTRELQSANATALALLEHDHLTGAASRRHFENHISRAFQNLAGRDTKIMLLMIDLDGFKAINDTLGHEIGDLVLITVAERLKGLVREGDIVARLGGDEFAVVCDNLKPDVDEDKICERFCDAIGRPFTHQGRDVLLSASIGSATAPRDGDTLNEMHRHADIALHVAKTAGRDRYVRYEREMSVAFEKRHQMTSDLRQALIDRELETWFQPKVDSRTGRVKGVEALARWRRPSGEHVPPDLFIRLAEEAGLIRELGLQMLERTCRAAKPWIEKGYIERAAVNLSPKQLDRDDVIQQIEAVLKDCDFDPRHLEFEITENYLMGSVEDAVRTLTALHALGSAIALDDFGTGYSNLNFLKKLPLDVLKIDKSFVDGIVEDASDQALVEAVIHLAKAFSLRTVAEGVEDKEQAQILAELGCDDLQGFYFARPMPADECGRFLEAHVLQQEEAVRARLEARNRKARLFGNFDP